MIFSSKINKLSPSFIPAAWFNHNHWSILSLIQFSFRQPINHIWTKGLNLEVLFQLIIESFFLQCIYLPAISTQLPLVYVLKIEIYFIDTSRNSWYLAFVIYLRWIIKQNIWCCWFHGQSVEWRLCINNNPLLNLSLEKWPTKNLVQTGNDSSKQNQFPISDFGFNYFFNIFGPVKDLWHTHTHTKPIISGCYLNFDFLPK